MQDQLDAEYGDLRIQLLGINPYYAEGGNELMTQGRDLPWLQDLDSDGDFVPDIWTTEFAAEWRDVVIVDQTGQQIAKYNLTDNPLEDPENFAELRQMLIDAATTLPVGEWHNPNNASDVNNDTHVSPIDALLIINSLNLDGSRELPPRTVEDQYYYDVSNDGFISPIDALRVINVLNNQT